MTKTNGNTATAAPADKKPKKERLSIKDPKILEVIIALKELTPLIIHRFENKALLEIQEKQGKKARAAKEARDPEEEYNAARYADLFGPERDGIKTIAFKKALIRGAKGCGLVMKDAFGALHIVGEFTEIKALDRVMRTDIVRIGQGTSTPRYRPQYNGWSVELKVHLITNSMSLDQMVAALRMAGLTCGVGEMRPEKSADTFGRFTVVSVSAQEISLEEMAASILGDKAQ